MKSNDPHDIERQVASRSNEKRIHKVGAEKNKRKSRRAVKDINRNISTLTKEELEALEFETELD